MRSNLRTRALTAALAGALLASLGLPATADDLDDQQRLTEARQAAVNQALRDLRDELATTDRQLVRAYADLKGIEAALPIAQEQLAAAEAELTRLEREAAIIAERLQAAQDEEAKVSAQIAADDLRSEEIQASLAQMARDTYKGDLTTAALIAILDAESSEEFLEQSSLAATAMRAQTQALGELEQISGVNRNREARLEAIRVQIADLKAEADAKVAEAEVARQQAAERKAELDQMRADAAAKAAFIEDKRAEQLALERQMEAEQRKLARELAEILEEQARRGNPGVLPDVARPLSYPVHDPVVITSSYGNRFHPVLKIWRMHTGTDFRAYCNAEILAAAGGTVLWARERGGYGNQVAINHGYWRGKSVVTTYSHLRYHNPFNVSAGDTVSRGQVIGWSGTTGTSTACHLHFEVYIDGAHQNPVNYLS